MDLSDKLKSLGVKVGAQELKPLARRGLNVDTVIPGRVQPTAYGDAFRVEALYPPDYRHGNGALAYSASLQMISEWGRANHLSDCDPSGFLFLDTETTGLSGGTGTYAFLVGVGRYTAEGFELVQFLMRDPTEEPALLTALSELVEPCQALVTYNGKAFDAPLLNTRYTLQGFSSPLPNLAHLDLLPLARRLWRDRLPSRTLGNVELSILGAARSQEEVPGYMIPQIYFDYLRSGDARPLANVLYHNAMDILSLAGLFSRTVSMLANPLELEIEEGLDLAAIARLFEDLGHIDAAVQIYRAGLEKGMPEGNFWDTIARLALLHRRRLEWSEALSLWKRAVENQKPGLGCVEAHVELAKYFEHTARDTAEALVWTQAAIECASNPGFPPYLRKQTLAGLEHRRARLIHKASQKSSR